MIAPKTMMRTRDWMTENNVPNSTFFKWKRLGLAPKTTNIGTSSYIFIEDLREWEARIRAGGGEAQS